jgi:hypothetical protein
MLDMTNYLIANPLVAVGLGILALLVLHNLRRYGDADLRHRFLHFSSDGC